MYEILASQAQVKAVTSLLSTPAMPHLQSKDRVRKHPRPYARKNGDIHLHAS